MSELIFVLNSATWPVLLLDGNADIYHRNPAAEQLFGSQPEGGGAAPLEHLWSPENSITAKAFVADWPRYSLVLTPLSFQISEGVANYSVNLCAFDHEGREWIILQLLPPLEQPASQPAHPPPTVQPQSNNTETLVQKQKLDCALQLARTVALDFNNALTSILGHTSLILGQMEINHPWRTSLVEVEKSAARAAEIANDLGTFSRQERDSRSQTAGNLNHLLQRVVELFKQTTGEKVSWTFHLSRKLYTAKFDEAKLQQVFIKLLENSLQSFDGQMGNITLQTRNVDLSSATQDCNAQLAPGSYVCMELLDNGSGILPKVLPRVFEPFFTTKKTPHRGLGLAWVYGVVSNHGGSVALSSKPGKGTAVRVYMPAENHFIEDSSFTHDELKGSQTVLIVDDEDLLLTMGQAILSSYGYKVLTANSGYRAVELLSQNELKLDLLVTDLVMPGMSGRELAEQARLLRPDLAILTTSGYIFPSKEEDRSSYLQKPFTSRDLLVKVKQVLAAKLQAKQNND